MDLRFLDELDNLGDSKPQEAFIAYKEGKTGGTTTGAEKPVTGENRPPERGINKRAETRLKTHGEELRKAREVYDTYGENIRKAGSLRADILKGMKRAEDPLALLLKAVDCIGLMTGDTVIYEQAQKTATAVYGWGLGDPYPLQLERREVEKRLYKLEKAVGRGNLDPAGRRRLQTAIDAHRDAIKAIDKEIARNEAGQHSAGIGA